MIFCFDESFKERNDATIHVNYSTAGLNGSLIHLHEFAITKSDVYYEVVSDRRMVDYLSNNKKID